MSYSTSKITTVADCDLLLAWAAKEKADLNFKKLSEERLTNNYSTVSIEIDAELQAVLTEITATDNLNGFTQTIKNVFPESNTQI